MEREFRALFEATKKNLHDLEEKFDGTIREFGREAGPQLKNAAAQLFETLSSEANKIADTIRQIGEDKSPKDGENQTGVDNCGSPPGDNSQIAEDKSGSANE